MPEELRPPSAEELEAADRELNTGLPIELVNVHARAAMEGITPAQYMIRVLRERRIAGLEADQRRIQRDLDGRVDYRDGGQGGYKLALIKPEGDYLARLQGRAAEVAEELSYWREHVARRQAEGVKVWSAADFAKGDYTLIHGSWAEVLRVNPKSVTVAFGVNVVNVPVVTKANAGGSTWTLVYDKVTARKSAAEMAEILAAAETVTA